MVSKLPHRQQCVTLGSARSDFVHVAKCVDPSCSHYINDISTTVTGCSIHLYADDTILYCMPDSVHSAIELLQHFSKSELTYIYSIYVTSIRERRENRMWIGVWSVCISILIFLIIKPDFYKPSRML